MAGWGDAGDEAGCGDGMGLKGMGGDGDVGWGGRRGAGDKGDTGGGDGGSWTPPSVNKTN